MSRRVVVLDAQGPTTFAGPWAATVERVGEVARLEVGRGPRSHEGHLSAVWSTVHLTKKQARDLARALEDESGDLADGLASARAEVARLTAECAAHRIAATQAREAATLALSVAEDCQQRWSRGHPDRVAKAKELLTLSSTPSK